MNRHLFVLILACTPFVLLAIGLTLAIWSGFFITRTKPVIPRERRLYLDRALRGTTNFVIVSAGVFLTAHLTLRHGYITGLAGFTAWASVACLRMVHRRFVLLQELAWEEYLYVPHGRPRQDRGPRYRFYYPTPKIPETVLMEKPTNRDPELVYLFKLFRLHDTWESLRAEVRRKCWHFGRRWLLYRTTGEISEVAVCRSWAEFGVENLTPTIAWRDLKSCNEFETFAQHWNYYALLVSRKTINRLTRVLFGPVGHASLFLLAYLVFFGFKPDFSDIPKQMRGILFGLSLQCSVVYAGVALMLYVYGKVLALDTLPSPVRPLGDPFFEATSHAAVVVSVGTAITVGLGVPLALSGTREPTLTSAIAAGLTTAGIFFVAVWGTHFSMESTKDRALADVVKRLQAATDLVEIERLKFRHRELGNVRVWPLSVTVLVNLLLAVALPIVLQLALERIMQ